MYNVNEEKSQRYTESSINIHLASNAKLISWSIRISIPIIPSFVLIQIRLIKKLHDLNYNIYTLFFFRDAQNIFI